MFTSTLAKTIEAYDPYGEHRLNGLKGIYIFMILCAVNMIYGIHNPYFNYFYVPLTALTAEMAGETIPAKYWLFFHVTMGSIVAIFLFSITVSYPLFFIFFVFFYSILHYLVALHFIKNIFIPIPITLSLAIYSLVYGPLNTDVYIAINNALITFCAMLIVIAALLLFPLKYYFRLWQRAYLLLLKQVLENFQQIQKNQPIPVIVQGHLVKMLKYTDMLPRKLPIARILKINVLMNDLRVLSCVIDHELIKISVSELQYLIENLTLLIQAVDNKKACALLPCVNVKNKTLYKMIQSWNQLCSEI